MAIAWHRVFGMALTQYFAGTGWQVDVEVDLSLKQQRLDLVVVRRGEAVLQPLWPDGFGNAVDYNLFTFKALNDPLNTFALKELVGHSVNYRKQISPDPNAWLPEEQFRLFAATMRFPQQLAGRVNLQGQGPGVYDVVWGTDIIRILVLNEMLAAERNVVWNLFSNDSARIATAFQMLRPRLHSWSGTLNDVLKHYGWEGMAMPYTLEDYKRDLTEEFLQELTPEQLLKKLTLEQRLQGLTPEQILTTLATDQRLQGLTPEQRLHGLPPEVLLAHLSREEIENYLKKHPVTPDQPSPGQLEKPN